MHEPRVCWTNRRVIASRRQRAHSAPNRGLDFHTATTHNAVVHLENDDGAEVMQTAQLDRVGGPPLSVLRKANLLLAAFDGAHTRMGLSELSRRSGVSKATVHRLAQELTELGLLRREGSDYGLGWTIYDLGQQMAWPANAQRLVRPTLLDLHAVTRAVVHMAVRRGNECVLVERFAGRREVGVLDVGDRVSLPHSASGRVFLAFDDPSVWNDAHSAHSAELRAELRNIRAHGWAEEREERVAGYRTYAVPIYAGPLRDVAATVSVTLDLARPDAPAVLDALQVAGASLSRSVGGLLSGPISRLAS